MGQIDPLAHEYTEKNAVRPARDHTGRGALPGV